MVRVENERKFRWLTLLALAGIIIVVELGFDNFGSDARFLNDYFDRSDYAHIGARILTGEIPYVDGATEYPQVPVYLFRGLTWLASRIFPVYWPVEAGFLVVWTFVVSVITLLVAWQVWRMLPEGKKRFAWLMFLPAAIYFCLNRFDIIPVYISLLAIMAIRRQRFTPAAILLAIGALTKWYLALIFPVFLVYELGLTRKLPWRSVIAFGSICIAILLPTFILGGWQAVWQPYAWHLNRLSEPGTFQWFVGNALGDGGLGWIDPAALTTFFTVLGFSGILLVFQKGLTSVNKVVLTSIAVLLLFIFFTRIFSPQWWLWILPFLILTIDTKLDLILIILYDLLDYAAFPITYDLTGSESTIHLLVTGSLLILIVFLFVRTIMKLKRVEVQVPV